MVKSGKEQREEKRKLLACIVMAASNPATRHQHCALPLPKNDVRWGNITVFKSNRSPIKATRQNPNANPTVAHTLANTTHATRPNHCPRTAPAMAPHLLVFFHIRHRAMGMTADPISTPMISCNSKMEGESHLGQGVVFRLGSDSGSWGLAGVASRPIAPSVVALWLSKR